MTKYIPIGLVLLLSTSCSNFVTHKEIAGLDKTKEIPSQSVVIRHTEPKVIIKEVVKVERNISSLDSDSTFDARHDLELDYKEKHFKFWTKYFSKREQARFLRHAKNGAKYRNVINEVLESHNLPKDLFYVGLIESGYNTYIKSRASAVGPWQFIKGTAKRYGLRVDNYVDERSHIIKATEAAASYFKDLYNIFGSWELALCAYNAGEYRIINAIRKGNTRDYKELVKKKLIPKETIFYIPKVAAARALYENPKKYGLDLPKSIISPFEKVKTVKVRKSFDLYKEARKHGLSLSEFKALNPDLRKRWIRVGKYRKQSIFLPSSGSTDFASLASSEKQRVAYTSKRSKKSSRIYKVRKGDNLSKIASRLGVKVSTLKRINRIKGSKIFVGQRLKVSSKAKLSSVKGRHIVRKGENLSLIARKYGMSVSQIKKANGMRSSRIYAGQKLKVSSRTPASIAKYKVRRGDNLTKIARRFGVSIPIIKQHNRLSSNMVYLGQVLKIPNEG